MKFSNHLCYLNAELIALAFFDPTISDQEKSEMAKRVLDTTETESSRIINPKYRRDQLQGLIAGGLSGLIYQGNQEFL